MCTTLRFKITKHSKYQTSGLFPPSSPPYYLACLQRWRSRRLWPNMISLAAPTGSSPSRREHDCLSTPRCRLTGGREPWMARQALSLTSTSLLPGLYFWKNFSTLLCYYSISLHARFPMSRLHKKWRRFVTLFWHFVLERYKQNEVTWPILIKV